MLKRREIVEIVALSTVAVVFLFLFTREDIVDIYQLLAIITVAVVSLFLVFYWFSTSLTRN